VHFRAASCAYRFSVTPEISVGHSPSDKPYILPEVLGQVRAESQYVTNSERGKRL